MQSPRDHSRRLRFGLFEVELKTGELTKQGKRVRLQEQPFQLLVMLLEKPGELVSREELQAKLWPQTTVDFDHGVNKAVGKIREALGDSATNPRFVETVARRGYRFLAEVAVAEITPQVAALEATKPGQNSPANINPESRIVARPRYHIPKSWFAAAVAFLVIGILLSQFQPPTVKPIRSLAVLPLENISNDRSQDYFADGMTEELITELGRIKDLRVISRTSAMVYKNSHKPLPEIARELKVEAVLEGRVIRVGDKVRITAQLIQLPADMHLWAQSYEGDLSETLKLQSKVARDVAQQIVTNLSLPETHTAAVNTAAYEAYLKGRFHWNKRTAQDLKIAVDYFKRSIEASPEFAKAHSGLADSYALMGDWEYAAMNPEDAYSQAKAAALDALSLDPSLGEAHTSLAFIEDLYGWNWKRAEAEYQRSIELNPSYATAHQWYGWHLIVMGRLEHGIAELRKAQRLDPLSLIVGADLADALCIAGRLDEAVQQSKSVLSLDTNFALGHFMLGQALTEKKQYGDAIEEFNKAIDLAGHSALLDANLALALAASGRRDEAYNIAGNLRGKNEQFASADANIALVYVALGDNDQAIAFLRKAYEKRFNPSILLRPGWDRLRSDVRFKELLGRIGLPS